MPKDLHQSEMRKVWTTNDIFTWDFVHVTFADVKFTFLVSRHSISSQHWICNYLAEWKVSSLANLRCSNYLFLKLNWPMKSLNLELLFSIILRQFINSGNAIISGKGWEWGVSGKQWAEELGKKKLVELPKWPIDWTLPQKWPWLPQSLKDLESVCLWTLALKDRYILKACTCWNIFSLKKKSIKTVYETKRKELWEEGWKEGSPLSLFKENWEESPFGFD